jgi:hypothetical protein
MTPGWPAEHGYVLEIEGDPVVALRLQPLGHHFDGATSTAMPAVNAIPHVVAAPPGILNHQNLPLITGRHRITPPGS